AVRYITFMPANMMAWTEEVSRLLLIWLVALTMATAHRENTHFKIELILDCLGVRMRSLVSVLGEVLLLVSFALFIVVGMRFAIDSVKMATATLQWPSTVFAIALVIGAIIMFIQGSVRLSLRFTRRSPQ
ncbi:TRAP transporter small permease, partial [Chloroflexota bacterium]